MDKQKEIIPGWEVVEQLGSGGFSTVYDNEILEQIGDADFASPCLVVITI